MGNIKDRRQVTLYADPLLYERVRTAAYMLGEDIYEFAGKAFVDALKKRLTPEQLEAVELVAQGNLKGTAAGASLRKRSPRR